MANDEKTQSRRYKTAVIYALVVALWFIGTEILGLTSLQVRTRQIVVMMSGAMVILAGVALYMAPIVSAKRKYGDK